jgi:cytochrome c553
MTRLIMKVIVFGVLIAAGMRALLCLVMRCAAPGEYASTAELPTAPARSDARGWIFRIAAFAVAAGLVGFLVAASGIFPIKASSGHWPITAWLLNFAMRRSVITHSLMIKAPPLDDGALVLKGAGHYEIGCRPCHGSPDLSHPPRIAQSMTPHPPDLAREVSKWDPEELFYIVKHGVKFTGMPAWPAQTRDDEVWAVVAFLLELPALTAAEYRRLVKIETPALRAGAAEENLLGALPLPSAVIESCGRCHGNDGTGRELPAFPRLARQKPQYFLASMQAYALGRRSSGIMEPIAAALSQEVTSELARYYAGVKNISTSEMLESKPGSRRFVSLGKADSKPAEGAAALIMDRSPEHLASIERGREIAMRGIPGQRVPACVECHGPGDSPRNPNYPMLAGQYAEYLVLQLTLFKKQARGGTAYAHLMRPVAAALTEAQMRDVAQFYESVRN